MSKHIGKRPKRKKMTPLPGSYLIATEGIQTEVIYFNRLADIVKEKYSGLRDRVNVTVPSLTIKGSGVSNLTLIERVEKLIQISPNLYEHVWVVFDKDDVPTERFDHAIDAAQGQGWQVAWSNDSFELWYVLHFEFLNTAISREAYKAKLTQHLKRAGFKMGYEKNSESILMLLDDEKQQRAIRFGKKLAAKNVGKPYHQQNPMTTVYQLVEELNRLSVTADILQREHVDGN